MNFKEATDDLFAKVDHKTLAKRLGVSVATIRQARLRPVARAHREPPANWRDGVIRMAEPEPRSSNCSTRGRLFARPVVGIALAKWRRR